MSSGLSIVKNVFPVKRGGVRQALQQLTQRGLAQRLDRTVRELPESPGRPATRLPGVWVASDLAERKRFIMLCSRCAPKFDPRTVGYVLDWRLKWQGRCNGCRSFDASMKGFLHESRIGRRSGHMRLPR